MATILTDIPATVFPWELDRIDIGAGAQETEVAVSLGLDGAVFFSATLVPEPATSRIALLDMAPLISDRAAALNVPATLTLTAGTDSAAATLLPCRARIDVTAEDFAAARFLSLAEGERVTFPRATELLDIYDAAGTAATPVLTCTWIDPDTGSVQTTTATALERQTAGACMRSFAWRPRDLSAPAEGMVLVRVQAACGRRTAAYTLRTASAEDAVPRSLGFVNAFGREETMHFFGTAEEEVKAERESAQIAGRGMVNYRTVLTPQWKMHTGFLTDGSRRQVADLCQSRDVWRFDDGTLLCVTDQELKREDGGRYEAPTATVTVREAAEQPMHRTAVGMHVFDETFDGTFN